MSTRRSRAALEAWLTEVEKLLQGQPDCEPTDERKQEDAA
jgi:hypothetical protein